MLVARQTPQVIHANPGQSYDFVFREDFLAGLDAHHFFNPTWSDAAAKLNAANVPCNSPSVWLFKKRKEREMSELAVLQQLDSGSGETAPKARV
jgi:hypothetical protein